MNCYANWIYDNPHPKGLLTRYCVKRALALATGKDYMEIQRELNQLKKVTNTAVYNDNKNWKYYAEKILKAKKISFPVEKSYARMDGGTFTTAYPKGIYLLRMAGHLTCCIDGIIHDTWNCTDKCVYNAWEVK